MAVYVALPEDTHFDVSTPPESYSVLWIKTEAPELYDVSCDHIENVRLEDIIASTKQTTKIYKFESDPQIYAWDSEEETWQGVVIIQFFVDDMLYKAPLGYTWRDFVENINGDIFFIEEETSSVMYHSGPILNQTPDTMIRADTYYHIAARSVNTEV